MGLVDHRGSNERTLLTGAARYHTGLDSLINSCTLANGSMLTVSAIKKSEALYNDFERAHPRLLTEGHQVSNMNTAEFGHWFEKLEDRPAAWVMSHLEYWMPKATTKRAGQIWVVRCFNELREEHAFPYSERTLKRAIQKLRTAGLVEVSMAPHPYRNGVLRARWLRLSN